jgi:hypothetical protein
MTEIAPTSEGLEGRERYVEGPSEKEKQTGRDELRAAERMEFQQTSGASSLPLDPIEE